MRARATSILCLAGLAVSSAGCGGGSTTIAWRPERPVVPPPPALAPPCGARDLTASLKLGGALGSMLGAVSVRNVSRRPCSLRGFPGVGFTGSTKRPEIGHISPEDTDRWAHPPRSSLRALAPGSGAHVRVEWSDRCGLRSASLLVTLAGSGSTLHVATPYAPRCDGPGQRPFVEISSWEPDPSPRLRLPLRIELVLPSPPAYSVKPGARYPLYQVKSGHVLRYAVTFVNVSRKPFRFGRCPIYEQLIPGPIRTFAYVLNCRPARTIPPGGRAVFAMRTPLPLTVGGSLVWWLARAANDSVEAVVRLADVPNHAG